MKTNLLTALLLILCGSSYGKTAINTPRNLYFKPFDVHEEAYNLVFTNWKIATNTSLGIVLLNFDAKRVNGFTQLYWKSINEQDVAYFLVQRSDDGKRYSDIYEQPTRPDNIGEQYSALDKKAINKMAYYRLKSIYRNGNERLSQVVKVSAVSK